MKLRLYLDTRSGTGPYPVRLGICRKGQTAFLTLSVKLMPDQWDADNQRPRRLPLSKWPQGPTITNYLDRRRTDIENILLRLEADGELHRMTALQIRDRIIKEEQGDQETVTLGKAFADFGASRRKPRTQELYACTWRKIETLCPHADRLTLEDITPEWLRRLDKDMQPGTPSVNARNVHFRNIRAVMNGAITAGWTQNYPFRNFKMQYEETDKLSLTLSQMRQLIALPCTGFAREYRDIFLLSFCLLGINITDLFLLQHSDYVDGRIHYRRSKTGRLYNVKVWPEAAALIERYRGERALLCIADRYKSSRNYTQHIDDGLKRLIDRQPFNELSTNWARHTYATLAFNELDATTDDVSAALGHKYGSAITAVYINPDIRKVDALNRRMLDLVFSSL